MVFKSTCTFAMVAVTVTFVSVAFGSILTPSAPNCSVPMVAFSEQVVTLPARGFLDTEKVTLLTVGVAESTVATMDLNVSVPQARLASLRSFTGVLVGKVALAKISKVPVLANS